MGFISSQSFLNLDFAKKLLYENESFSYNSDTFNKEKFNIIFNQSFYLNDNLPNLENLNGFYPHKGYGGFTGILFLYKNKNFMLSAEPLILISRRYDIENSQKTKLFSVLNDVPQNNLFSNNKYLRNFGIKYRFNKFTMSYGNWSQWWGPGMHSSLIMTNNSTGFYHYNFEYGNYHNIKSKIKYNIKYSVSRSLVNTLNSKFYISSLYINGAYKDLEIGISNSILSGGYPEQEWNIEDAFQVTFSNKKIKYWDKINDFYIKYSSKKNKFVAFLQIGIPDSHKSGNNLTLDSRNTIGSNLGLRKYNAFNLEGLILGVEYIRLLQGKFFDISPTNNWYDNIKYSYSSYQGRRWAAHSGSDSDDFLLYFGHIGPKNHGIFGFNYERHGVTFKFPPEIKYEFKINAGIRVNSLYISLIYENELFEHYSFVDNSDNIWSEDFENGSIQRTKTLFFNIEKKIN